MCCLFLFMCFILFGCKGIDTIGGEPIDDRERIRLHMPTTFNLHIYLNEDNADSIRAGICTERIYLDTNLFDVNEYFPSAMLDLFQKNREMVVNNGNLRYCDPETYRNSYMVELLVDDDKHIRFILLDSLNEEKSFDIDLNPLFTQFSKEDSVFTFSFHQNFRSIELYSYDYNSAPSSQCYAYGSVCYVKELKVNIALDTNRLHACDSENPSIGNDFEGFPPISYLSKYQYTCPLIEVHDVVSTYLGSFDYCHYCIFENLSEYSVAIKDLYNPKRRWNEILEKYNNVIELRPAGSMFTWQINNMLTNQSSYKTDSIFLHIQYNSDGGYFSRSDSNTTEFP